MKALYADEIFFNLRNSFPEPITKHLEACFTPSLINHFYKSRQHIAGWLADKSHANMKLPMGEGMIFLSEDGESFKVRHSVIDGDIARVPVSLTHRVSFLERDRWIDVALLHRSAGVWLLDDIEYPYGYILRYRTSVHGPD